MEIKGKVHCFFEQSGTFKNEFIKLGIPAEDYDIQDHFGETDHVMDLFKEIDEAWEGRPSVFDGITPDDLILAFFPCIYFCNYSDFNQRQINDAMKRWSKEDVWKWKLEHSRNRQRYYELALMLTATVETGGLRMIAENPWNVMNYTNFHWFNKPSMIDYNRQRRGDYFVKPTAYWFINCEPARGFTWEAPERKMRIAKYGSGENVAKGSGKAGLCSEERSMISPAYAHNFICDNILGTTEHRRSQLELDFA